MTCKTDAPVNWTEIAQDPETGHAPIPETDHSITGSWAPADRGPRRRLALGVVTVRPSFESERNDRICLGRSPWMRRESYLTRAAGSLPRATARTSAW